MTTVSNPAVPANKATNRATTPSNLDKPVILSAAQRSRRTCFSSCICFCLPLLLALTSPAIIRAQFQPPTDEELKMTADPKAPGAAAVYLSVEEISDDPLHFQSFYARIKVLQEKGKELATVELPYLKGRTEISDIKARTIHSDGTIIPLIGKPEDLLVSKTTSKYGELEAERKVFTLPSVEVGSILEYRYDLRYEDYVFITPLWEIQRPYFVHKAHYAFTPFAGFLNGVGNTSSRSLMGENGGRVKSIVWWSQLPTGTTIKTDAIGRYSLDMTDIPAVPHEEWMPPVQSLLYHVFFYYKTVVTSNEFWTSEAKRWSKEVDHFAESSKSIHDEVSGLIAPGDSDLDKAKKLYKAVQALDNTDFSRKKGETELKQLKLKTAKRAEDTLAQKSGSSDDIALLYLAMLRDAGLNAYAMKVVNRDRGVFDPSYLNFDQLQDDLVILNTGGKDIVLDPGEKMCPFQTVHWRHSGAGGIRQSVDDRAAAASPFLPYAANTLTRTGDVTLDSHGGITATLRFVMNGQEALRWRQTALRNDQDEVKKRFDRELESMVPEGVEAHVHHFLGLDDPDVVLMAIVNAHGSLGTATSKRLLLPGFFFETRSGHPFVDQEKREKSVDMHYAEQVTDQIVYQLPSGFALEGAPQDTKIPWQGHAVLVETFTAEPTQITVTRTLARAFTLAKPEEYQDLRGFYQKVATADQAQLVLTRTGSSEKGN